jgi:hypothetical protein
LKKSDVISKRDTIVACIRGDDEKLLIFSELIIRRQRNFQTTPFRRLSKEWMCKLWVSDVIGWRVRSPPPLSLLILSSLDNGFFETFKWKLIQQIELHPVRIGSHHFKAAFKTYNSILSASAVKLFNKSCELIGTESLNNQKNLSRTEIQVLNNKENRECLQFFEKWGQSWWDCETLKVSTLQDSNREEPSNFYWVKMNLILVFISGVLEKKRKIFHLTMQTDEKC